MLWRGKNEKRIIAIALPVMFYIIGFILLIPIASSKYMIRWVKGLSKMIILSLLISQSDLKQNMQ